MICRHKDMREGYSSSIAFGCRIVTILMHDLATQSAQQYIRLAGQQFRWV